MDDLFYYAMEYVDGLTIDRLVRDKGPVNDGRVLHFLLQACGSLAEAHAHGLVHRDVKPQNIIISEGVGYGDRITVLDFGLVSITNETSGQGRTIRGTPCYMSPESAACHETVDARSDLYSLAASAYFMLTGRPIFDGTIHEVLSQHIQTPPVRPSERTNNAIAGELEELLMQCLQKDPQSRPASAGQMIERLTGCATEQRWSQKDSVDWWESFRRHPIATTSVDFDACAETVIGMT